MNEDQFLAREETEDRLRSRGILVYSWEGDEDAEDLLDAIERFELVAEWSFLPPSRAPGESIGDYQLRIEAATDQLRRRSA